jgi:hypothetical protein
VRASFPSPPTQRSLSPSFFSILQTEPFFFLAPRRLGSLRQRAWRRKGWDAVQKLISLQKAKIPDAHRHLLRMNLAALVIPGVIRQGPRVNTFLFSHSTFFHVSLLAWHFIQAVAR